MQLRFPPLLGQAISAWPRAAAALRKKWDHLREISDVPPPAPDAFMDRIRLIERDMGLVVKVVVFGFLFVALFYLDWLGSDLQPRIDAINQLKIFFLGYVAANVGAGFILWGMNEFSPRIIERVVYIMAILDAALLTLLTYVTGGFDSLVYWMYLGLVVRNAAGIPHPDVQVAVNLLTSAAFLLGGFLGDSLDQVEYELTGSIGRGAVIGSTVEANPEPVLLRLLLLVLLTIFCVGIQLLFDRQRRAELEAQGFLAKEHQLQAAGRLAAEIAHQLKNPLAIINNAAWSIQQAAGDGRSVAAEVDIIREEVQKSDRILTDLMGFARLAEGRVERMEFVEEIENAIAMVFPEAARFDIKIHRNYALGLPTLAAQRAHFSEVFVNLLTNARDAMDGRGELFITVVPGPNLSVQVTLRDTGPGIPPAHLEKIFEPYFTTKMKGTGLGLAIVRHNTELYGGNVTVESTLGKGTAFTLTLPARTLLRLQK